MASGKIEKTVRSINQTIKEYSGITGSAESNIYLTNTISSDLGTALSKILSLQIASDSGFNGAVYNIYRNGDSVYLKANKALSNAKLFIYWNYYE